jgi:hypothetical protein
VRGTGAPSPKYNEVRIRSSLGVNNEVRIQVSRRVNMAKTMQSTGMQPKPTLPKSKGMGHSVKSVPAQPCPCDSQPKPYQPKGK